MCSRMGPQPSTIGVETSVPVSASASATTAATSPLGVVLWLPGTDPAVMAITQPMEPPLRKRLGAWPTSLFVLALDVTSVGEVGLPTGLLSMTEVRLLRVGPLTYQVQ
jgi:hypothetical protein